MILGKGESLKTVLDARYLSSLIDDYKCNWPIEPINLKLTKMNEYYTSADISSAYNQKPLDKNRFDSHNMLLEINNTKLIELFYGISIGSAAF